MTVGEAFLMSGQVYVMGVAVALGIAAMIKLICYIIDRSESKTKSKVHTVGEEEGVVQ